jgi:hypothetical protein
MYKAHQIDRVMTSNSSRIVKAFLGQIVTIILSIEALTVSVTILLNNGYRRQHEIIRRVSFFGLCSSIDTRVS